MKLTLISIAIFLLSPANSSKFKLLKFEKCDPDAEYVIDMNVKIREENGQQYIEELRSKNPVPLGHNVELSIDISLFEKGEYNHLMTIEKDYCDALYEYAPEMTYEVEKMAGIEPGACPIPAGEYRIEKYPIDFDKFKQDEELIEEGQIKAVVNLIDTDTQSNLNCMVVEVAKVKDE